MLTNLAPGCYRSPIHTSQYRRHSKKEWSGFWCPPPEVVQAEEQFAKRAKRLYGERFFFVAHRLQLDPEWVTTQPRG